MILLDANLLVYSYVDTFSQHDSAQAWLDSELNGSAPVGMPWQSVLAFVRLVSNPRIFDHPVTVVKAWQQVESWLECPVVWIPVPTDRHYGILRQLLTHGHLRSNHVPDAQLAALALEHNLVLHSTDGDFARFPGLRWKNPLAS